MDAQWSATLPRHMLYSSGLGLVPLERFDILCASEECSMACPWGRSAEQQVSRVQSVDPEVSALFVAVAAAGAPPQASGESPSAVAPAVAERTEHSW